MSTTQAPAERFNILTALCRELVKLARHEEETAADEASRTPYWMACPPSVEGHRTAARALWADVQRLEAEARNLSWAS